MNTINGLRIIEDENVPLNTIYSTSTQSLPKMLQDIADKWKIDQLESVIRATRSGSLQWEHVGESWFEPRVSYRLNGNELWMKESYTFTHQEIGELYEAIAFQDQE